MTKTLSLSVDKIKEDVSKIYDVRHWTFFFNTKGGLEFYDTDPNKGWIYNSNFSDYDEDIKSIAERLACWYKK